MPFYICLNDNCKFLPKRIDQKTPIDKGKRNRVGPVPKAPQCRECKKLMDLDDNQEPLANAKKEAFNFDDAMGAVLQAEQLPTRQVYVKAVIAQITTADQFFRDEFTKDMKNPSDLKEFVSGKRSEVSGVVCVDSAHKVCGLALPTGAPKGSKFDWELPYLMSYQRWTLLQPVMQDGNKFGDFVNRIANGEQYVVSTLPDAGGSKIGHTITVTKTATGELWVSDAQKLTNEYQNHRYVAWQRPKGQPAKTDSLNPKRKIDSSGKWIGEWESK